MTVVLDPDVPMPRCVRITGAQRLTIVNRSGATQGLRLGPLHATLVPGAQHTFAPLGGQFAPGVHDVHLSAPPLNAEVWLT
ncbi:MAG: hypothetical protein JOZ99_01115 [Actinobacteria bacterium]|nr:hypothetical protein [Actinomycetota bacterium]